MTLLTELAEAVEAGRAEDAENLTRQALDQGFGPVQIMTEGLQAGLVPVGERFKNGEAYIPEVLLAARALQSGMSVLRPLIANSDSMFAAGTVVLGTVKEDLHDIGKNMVGMMLEGSGFKVVDLGVNVEPKAFCAAVREYRADLVCMSALLSTTLRWLKASLEQFEAEGLRSSVKVMIGGAPVTADYAAKIGADGFAEDAARAADMAKVLMERRG